MVNFLDTKPYIAEWRMEGKKYLNSSWGNRRGSTNPWKTGILRIYLKIFIQVYHFLTKLYYIEALYFNIFLKHSHSATIYTTTLTDKAESTKPVATVCNWTKILQYN